MASRRHLVSTASRSLVFASRRCRTAKETSNLPNLRGVASSSSHAYDRFDARNNEAFSRPSLKASRLSKCSDGGGIASRERQRLRERGQSRALSMDPAQTAGGQKETGDTQGTSTSDTEEVFIRAGGEFGTDGDPGPPPPLDPSIVTEPSDKVLKVMDDIEALDLMEVSMLIEVFKERLGLDEVPSLNFDEDGGGAGDAKGEGGADAAEKSLFNVNVTGFDEKSKIKVIKEIRAITGLGLREAKELVEGLPKVVKTDVKKEEGEKIVQTLEAVGATVTLE